MQTVQTQIVHKGLLMSIIIVGTYGSVTDRKPVGSDDDATKIKHPVNCVIL